MNTILNYPCNECENIFPLSELSYSQHGVMRCKECQDDFDRFYNN